MDQNSTNDTDKRNWRERLGIGSKEMPRISGEFTKAPEAPSLNAKPDMKPAQPVAKPAPMAPRLPMKSVAAPAPQVARPQQQVLPQSMAPQAPDALAEKLRSQRAAAEKLAEQRVTAAKQRAENAPVAPAKALVPPAEKPKFSFADEDGKPDFGREPRALPPGKPPQRPIPQQPQLLPPRPPLGGQPQRPAAGAPAGFQPQYRPQPPKGYRPIDPALAYVPPPLQQPQRGFNSPMSQPPSGGPRLPTPRMNPDGYRRGPQDDLGYTGAGYEPPQHSLRQGAMRGQPQAFDDDYGDEIFEDAPPPRSSRRASATDYNQAYRENEGAYGDDRRRSSGPWLLLLFLMLAAGAAGAGVWYYQTKVKSVAANVSTDSAPVVAAPQQSAKSAPEQPLDGQPNTDGSTSSKKQIYDRIIGDNEVLGGRVVPTEETPIQPEAQQGDAEQIPQAAGSTGSSGEALPLPMPPPPGGTSDTQGALSTSTGNESAALTTPATSAKSTDAAGATEIAPVPGEDATAATTEQAKPPAATAPAKEEIVNVAPVKKKPVTQTAATTTNAKTENNVSLGAEPVVLVPPSDSADASQSASAPVIVDQPVATQPVPVVKKKKTLFGLFNGTNNQAPVTQTATTAPAAPQQQVASLPQPAPIQPQTTPTQGAPVASGYFVQLASFKTEAEASAEFGRLKLKYASIIGSLPSTVNPATVGDSTRYRLAVGPLSSHDQATNICSSLVAAGERDCLVRKQ